MGEKKFAVNDVWLKLRHIYLPFLQLQTIMYAITVVITLIMLRVDVMAVWDRNVIFIVGVFILYLDILVMRKRTRLFKETKTGSLPILSILVQTGTMVICCSWLGLVILKNIMKPEDGERLQVLNVNAPQPYYDLFYLAPIKSNALFTYTRKSTKSRAQRIVFYWLLPVFADSSHPQARNVWFLITYEETCLVEKVGEFDKVIANATNYFSQYNFDNPGYQENCHRPLKEKIVNSFFIRLLEQHGMSSLY